MNRLNVSFPHSILTLAQGGWSARRIARELDINRETVGRYLRSIPAISTTAFTAGRKSDSSIYSAEIETGLTSGLLLKRIHQDLVSDHAFTGSYQSVKRFAHKFAASVDPPFRRIECVPGEEMQVDFVSAGWVVEAARRRRPHLFRCVLSHSRKGYTEAVWRRSTEIFLRCMETRSGTLAEYLFGP